MKSFYDQFTFTIAANSIHTLNSYNSFLTVLENSSGTAVKVGIGGGRAKSNLNKGLGVELPQGAMFTSIIFENTTAAIMTLTVALSSGRIYDNRLVIATDVDVVDISDGLTTPAAIVALDPTAFLIDNAAAVNKGGGLVGIPVTGHPFATGETVTIANTVNYDGDEAIVSQTANEIVITAAFVAETFDGVDDSVALTTPRLIAADSTRKELIVHNHHATKTVYWGDANIDPANNRGVPVPPGSAYVITSTAEIYLASDAGGGSGCTVSYANLTKT